MKKRKNQIRVPHCLKFLEAVEGGTDCKDSTCEHHLLYDELKLDQSKIHKGEKYYNTCGCDLYLMETWELGEIADLWGLSGKQAAYYYEKQGLRALKKVIGINP